MSTTPNLSLPYIVAAQAQKHVTHNEAIRALDAIVHLSVLSQTLTVPPGSPADGERYLVGASASGDWAGHDNEVAAYQDGAWMFYVPQEGWIAWVAGESAAVVYDGGNWVAFSGGGSGSVNPTPLVGINATADTTNRLSLNSPASLFNHEGAGHQVKVNKNAAGDSASFLFQTAFSARAEIGTTGDDDFRFKVSADGSAFKDAIIINRSSEEVTFPFTTLGGGSGSGVGANILINGDFQINQRSFAGGALGAGVYGHDRWKAAAGGADYSVANFVVTLTSGELEQVIEPALWGEGSFASKQVTVSIEDPSEDLTVTFGSQSGTVSAGTGRQSVALTLGTGDTGSLSFKAKRAAAGTVTFGRIKLEIGNAATGWTARPDEEQLCQRYFYRRKYGGSFDVLGIMSAFSNNRCWGKLFDLPVSMRAAGTVTYSNASHLAGWTNATKAITGLGVTMATTQTVSQTGGFTTSGTWTIGDAVMLYFSNSAGYIDVDAEL